MGLVDFLMGLNGGSIGLSLGFPIGCLGVRFFGEGLLGGAGFSRDGFSGIPRGEGFSVEGLSRVPRGEEFSSILDF